MKKLVLVLLACIFTVILPSTAKAELHLKKMQPAYQFRMNGDSGTGMVSTINGKDYYSDTFTPQFINNFSSCREYQQSDYGGYVVYQILGRDAKGRCKYRKMSNGGLLGGDGSSWKAVYTCSFSQLQINALASAMRDTRANKKMRSFKAKGVEYSADMSYYDYLMWYFSAQGFCKK